MVFTWIYLRKLNKLPLLPTDKNYVVINDNEMSEFDDVRKVRVGNGHEVIIPDLPVIHKYCKQTKTFKVDVFHGLAVILLDKVECDLVEWVQEYRFTV